MIGNRIRHMADEGEGDRDEPLARKVASLASSERAKLWRELVAARKQNPAVTRRRRADQVASQLDELLAQIAFLRSELEDLRKRVRREPARRLRG